MREIGGYFQLGFGKKKSFYKKTIAINTARNAIRYLNRTIKIEKIYLPYYLCDSVYKVCEEEGIAYEFYNIDKSFMPLLNKPLFENEFLYIVNYFGQLSKKTIKRYKKIYKNLIVDNVQAFFEPPIDGVITIYSCRKFFGVPDGAYLAGDIKLIELEKDLSANRMTHVLGRVESTSASNNFKDYQNNEELLCGLPLKSMSKLTETILEGIEYKSFAKKRQKNWKVLSKYLGVTNGIKVKMSKGPYCYPFYCKNGVAVRKKLAESGIFVPTLWPDVFNFEGCELEKDFVENILPLPIDQRYGKEDMELIIEEIKCLKI